MSYPISPLDEIKWGFLAALNWSGLSERSGESPDQFKEPPRKRRSYTIRASINPHLGAVIIGDSR